MRDCIIHPTLYQHYTFVLFQYYAHKEKLQDLGRGADFDNLNRAAHDIAKKVIVDADNSNRLTVC